MAERDVLGVKIPAESRFILCERSQIICNLYYSLYAVQLGYIPRVPPFFGQNTPTTPLDLAVPCRWRWDAPGEYAVTGRAHLQVGQQLTAEVLTDAVGNLRRR